MTVPKRKSGSGREGEGEGEQSRRGRKGGKRDSILRSI